jgi:hypothetical protein
MERDTGLPRDLMTAQKNSISENARAHDESSSPQIDPSQRKALRQKVELVPLVGASGAGAYCF